MQFHGKEEVGRQPGFVIDLGMYVSKHACMYVCMYVCLYVRK